MNKKQLILDLKSVFDFVDGAACTVSSQISYVILLEIKERIERIIEDHDLDIPESEIKY